MQPEEPNKYVKELTQEKYKYGFTTDVHTEVIERGLNEDVVRLISAKKNEPEWLLEFRLKAYRHWLTMEMPTWVHLRWKHHWEYTYIFVPQELCHLSEQSEYG